MSKNNTASVLAKLKNKAKERQEDYNHLLLLYAQEALLYRLSLSDYRDNFVLKGGLLLYQHYQKQARPTRDVDFLARQLTYRPLELETIFRNIVALELEDGLSFDLASLESTIIKEGADYEGIRLKLLARFGSARQALHIDIAFGDIITPKATQLNYPSLLKAEGFSILAYPLETVVAEKLQAMVELYVCELPRPKGPSFIDNDQPHGSRLRLMARTVPRCL